MDLRLSKNLEKSKLKLTRKQVHTEQNKVDWLLTCFQILTIIRVMVLMIIDDPWKKSLSRVTNSSRKRARSASHLTG